MRTQEVIHEHENIQVILQDRFLKREFLQRPQISRGDNGSTILKLDLSNVDFYQRERNIYDIFFLFGNKRYRALSDNIPLEKKESRYYTSVYKINNAEVAVPYLTIKNNLSILYGNASVLFKEFCSAVTTNETVHAPTSIESQFISIQFASFPFDKHTSFLAFYDDEKESYVSLPYIQDENDANRIFIDLKQYPSCSDIENRLAVQQKERNTIVTFKLNTAVSNHKANAPKKAVIKSHMTLDNIDYSNRKISFEIDDLCVHNDAKYRLFLKDKDGRTFFPEMKYTERNKLISFKVNLEDFINTYASMVSKWHMYIEVEHQHFIEVSRLGVYDAPLQPAYKRYFNDQDIEDYHVITPYLTIKNGLSIVITTLVSLHNEIWQPVTSVTDFKREKGGIFSGEISLELKRCEDYVVKSLLLKFRDKLESKEYHFDVREQKESKNKSLITFKMDISNLSFEPLHWDFFLQMMINGHKYLIRVKNPQAELKEKIKQDKKKYHFKLGDGFMVYPYITINDGLSLTYRQKEKYESKWHQFKEWNASLIYQLFKNHFDKKRIWLVYEKFAQTAQDNSYYFFKYAYENHPDENIYYVIDKSSSDYVYLKGMEDRVISFMSLKHLLYLYASKLFVSSEAKGHAYILRKQNGALRNIVNEKKFVFLQHGVLGFKKVDAIFRKDSNNGANLFVTSSEIERNIVTNNFRYDKEDVVVTGLCRWDALVDKSNHSDGKEILLMPTWRSWLDDVPDSKFVESEYYHNYIKLLNSKRLNRLLESYDILIHFYIHPKFKAYIDKFETNNKNIKLYQFGEEKVNELLMRSDLLITDYSSVAWDQYYQKKPVIFYQFDHNTYEILQGSYIEMDKNLFGDRVFDFNQLLHTIETYIDRDFVEKEKYAAMRDQYFEHVDRDNSKRNFAEIINNKQKLNLK
jgi:CDP-glycerol glycerophosphotransferase (TagB/SpsB family)